MAQCHARQDLVCLSCKGTLFTAEAFRLAWGALQDKGYEYTVKLKNVRSSATSGCHWCKELLPQLLDWVVNPDKQRTTDDPEEETFSVNVSFRPAKGLSFGLPIVKDGRNIFRLEIDGIYTQPYTVHADYEDIASHYITAREILWQVGTKESFKQALARIRECSTHAGLSGHENCLPAISGRLPTRVIDCKNPKKPRLHLSAADEHGFYAALSYVWGEDQPSKTTKDNINMYKTGIDRRIVPRTILDAIDCAHALGIRFLWVDAFCILQDDKEDKQAEISRMRNIYRGAYVTVIAASAARVSGGFLQDRKPPSSGVQLPFICPEKDSNEGKVGIMLIRSYFEGSQWNSQNEPVNSPAWCLEERLLSPRLLIYTSHSLQFSCVTRKPEQLGEALTLEETLRLEPFMFRRDLEDEALSSEQELVLRNNWNSIVSEYTRRELTHEKDRLVALGGIAEEFQRFGRNSRYLAGLWSHNLLEDLLWTRSEESHSPRPGQTDGKYRGPTWSWASVNGSVLPAERMNLLWPKRCKYLCRVLHCETTLRAELNPFGQVTGGVLKLQAILNAVHWDPTRSTLALPRLGSYASEGIISRFAYRDCDEPLSKSEGMVWALPVRQCAGEFNRIEGILVILVDREANTFRRVGSFVIGTGKSVSYFNPQSWISSSMSNVSII